jgi:hypothetical protein
MGIARKYFIPTSTRLRFGRDTLDLSYFDFSEGLPHLQDEHDNLVTSGRDLFKIPVKQYDPYPDMDLPGYQTPMGWWYATLSWYQRRNISVHNDLLPAIAGVAKIIGQCSGYHYKAGLWLEDIHRGLLWI